MRLGAILARCGRILNAPLQGPVSGWVDELARPAAEYRFGTVPAFVPDEDPIGFIRRLGEDAAPVARELVEQIGA